MATNETTSFITTVTETITTVLTTTARPTRSPNHTTTITPGTGLPDERMVFSALSVASVSLAASLLVLSIYLIHRIGNPTTVLRNSLNYLWAFVVFTTLLGSVQTLVGRLMWYQEGAEYAGNKNFCAFGAATEAGQRVLLALSLLMFYVNMFVVRRYDEPFAHKCLKWYFLIIFLGTSAIVAFSASTAPSSYREHNDRCVLIVDSIQGNAPLIIPLVMELAIVVVGFISVFALLCSRSKINSASSRRRVWIHVFFMAFLFLTRLAMTVAMFVYRRSDDGDDEEHNDGDQVGNLIFILGGSHSGGSSNIMTTTTSLGFNGEAVKSATTIHAFDNSFLLGSGNSVRELSDAPLAVRVLLLINLGFSWGLGLITSIIFAYTECLYLILRLWCIAGCGAPDDIADYEPFLPGGSNPSFYSEPPPSSANPRPDASSVGDTIDDESEVYNSTASRLLGHNGPDPNNINRLTPNGGNAFIHTPGQSMRAVSAVSLEEHLQGYTLSYTIRSSSNFADGEIPA